VDQIQISGTNIFKKNICQISSLLDQLLGLGSWEPTSPTSPLIVFPFGYDFAIQPSLMNTAVPVDIPWTSSEVEVVNFGVFTCLERDAQTGFVEV
jgi:hypothetical protein